ncbi:MAG: hypothetical protein Q9165_005418 [Trypethelium subeluteriae]
MENLGNEKISLEREVLELEEQLKQTRTKLNQARILSTLSSDEKTMDQGALFVDAAMSNHSQSPQADTDIPPPAPHPSLHALLLLSDSALPLGSFAFSNGLESYLAHHRSRSTRSSSVNLSSSPSTTSLFHSFLHLSILNTASTTLPFLLTTFRDPTRLEECDDVFDATLSCTVARRASTAQGRALVGVWEKSFTVAMSLPHSHPSIPAIASLKILAQRLRTHPAVAAQSRAPSNALEIPTTYAHFAPVFGAAAASMGLGEYDTAYVFLLSHAKAVVSAGVRAGVLGPFAGQGVLAGTGIFGVKGRREGEEGDGKGGELPVGLRELIEECILRERETSVEEGGITVPAMDLWQGRHELLYSRIFNS